MMTAGVRLDIIVTLFITVVAIYHGDLVECMNQNSSLPDLSSEAQDGNSSFKNDANNVTNVTEVESTIIDVDIKQDDGNDELNRSNIDNQIVNIKENSSTSKNAINKIIQINDLDKTINEAESDVEVTSYNTDKTPKEKKGQDDDGIILISTKSTNTKSLNVTKQSSGLNADSGGKINKTLDSDSIVSPVSLTPETESPPSTTNDSTSITTVQAPINKSDEVTEDKTEAVEATTHFAYEKHPHKVHNSGVPYHVHGDFVHTFFSEQKHRKSTFRHHLQLVPMEDEPYGGIIIKDERYMVSVLIPVGVGILGAGIIVATLYTLRYIARKHGQEFSITDFEEGRQRTPCISSISSERTDKVVLLGGTDEDDEI